MHRFLIILFLFVSASITQARETRDDCLPTKVMMPSLNPYVDNDVIDVVRYQELINLQALIYQAAPPKIGTFETCLIVGGTFLLQCGIVTIAHYFGVL